MTEKTPAPATSGTTPVDRRDFLRSSAIAGTALTLSAASASRVYGANERIGIAFIGVGGRCQAHLDIVNNMVKEGKPVFCAGVCDVWDGAEEEYDHEFGGTVTKRKYLQGLFPSAKKMGLDIGDKKRVVKDYHRILELPDVDVVCIGTPDHWHARMSIDAADAKKHVYCEKPMTRTIAESQAVVEAMVRNNTVMTVGVQSMVDPVWREANKMIRAGKIGHVAQGTTSYYRNDARGQWRYYRLLKEMNPKTIDWKMFLGSEVKGVDGKMIGPDMAFDRSVFGQWRCYWPFGGGMFTDLFVHQTTHLIEAMGIRYPKRVAGSGGLYLEYDGRDVPDVATIVAEYEEGCQSMVTAAMISSYPIEEVIRGRLGTLRFIKKPIPNTTPKQFRTCIEFYADDPSKGAGIPARLGDTVMTPKEVFEFDYPVNDTRTLWDNFLECVRMKNRGTLSTPELGAAAFTTVSMGMQSYRSGQILFWDKEKRMPIAADASWAAGWEKRSHERGKPNQIIGWQGGDAGSTMKPPAYMKLAGPWTDGKDPADG